MEPRIAERTVRTVAGTLVLITLVLGIWVSGWWWMGTAFVGLNLLQSGLTDWCLLERLLRRHA